MLLHDASLAFPNVRVCILEDQIVGTIGDIAVKRDVFQRRSQLNVDALDLRAPTARGQWVVPEGAVAEGAVGAVEVAVAEARLGRVPLRVGRLQRLVVRVAAAAVAAAVVGALPCGSSRIRKIVESRSKWSLRSGTWGLDASTRSQ